jgi:branched-chain amino acid transport system permease protein
VAGGLAALNNEIVNAESLSASTSGLVLLATYLGGIAFFAGPIVGAIAITLMQSALGLVTKAWPFYFGAMFLATVLFVPGGLTGVALWHKRLWDAGLIGRALPVYAAMTIPITLTVGATIAMVEMAYRETRAAGPWAGAIAGLLIGAALSRWAWRRSAARWAEIRQRIP